MEKIDFDILLKPVKTSTVHKDVALVDTIASSAQQIKNIVLMGQNEIPFSRVIGAGVKEYLNTEKSKIFLVESIESTITNSIKNIFNISVTLTESTIPKQQLIVTVKFDYVSKVLSKKNNTVRIPIDL